MLLCGERPGLLDLSGAGLGDLLGDLFGDLLGDLDRYLSFRLHSLAMCPLLPHS